MADRPAIFLDRDGTIIVNEHYLNDPDKVVLLPDAIAGMRMMIDKGYDLFVVSNQSGVGRGLISTEQFREVHQRFQQLLEREGVQIQESLFCFHTPAEQCKCRKPEIGLIPLKYRNTQLGKSSWVVGDRECDLELGRNFGARSCLVLTGYGATTAKNLVEPMILKVPSLLEFAKLL